MAIKFGTGSKIDRDKFDADFQAALLAHSENPTAETQARLVQLYEQGTNFKGGCGACRNGRTLMIRGLAAIAAGDKESGLAQVRGAFSSVGFKLDRLKKALGIG